jgi:hypothetical protein
LPRRRDFRGSAGVSPAPGFFQPSASSLVPDRQTIARLVERFLAQKGVGTPASGPANPAGLEAAAPTPPPPPTTKVVDFVCENDVRAALEHNEKIHIGPGTIVTPSARDLAAGKDLFVTSQQNSR